MWRTITDNIVIIHHLATGFIFTGNAIAGGKNVAVLVTPTWFVVTGKFRLIELKIRIINARFKSLLKRAFKRASVSPEATCTNHGCVLQAEGAFCASARICLISVSVIGSGKNLRIDCRVFTVVSKSNIFISPIYFL